MSDRPKVRIGWRDVFVLLLALGVGAVLVAILRENFLESGPVARNDDATRPSCSPSRAWEAP